MEMASATEYCPITRLHQRLQVFVEYAKIADSENVWLLCETSEEKVFRYLIPKKDVVQGIIIPSEDHKQDRSISTLLLSVQYPYKIEIDQIGWLYSGLQHRGEELGEMIAFNSNEVSYRLDPI